MLVVTYGRDGSTVLYNLLRLLLESQFAAVIAGHDEILAFSEWNHWISNMQTPVLVKTHDVKAKWMSARRDDGSPLVDHVFSSWRSPVESVCSKIRMFENMSEDRLSNEVLRFHLRERFVKEESIQVVIGRRIAMVVDFNMLRDNREWEQLLQQLGQKLGIEVHPAVRQNMLQRLAHLSNSNRTTFCRLTQSFPKHKSDLDPLAKAFREACVRHARWNMAEIVAGNHALSEWVRVDGRSALVAGQSKGGAG